MYIAVPPWSDPSLLCVIHGPWTHFTLSPHFYLTDLENIPTENQRGWTVLCQCLKYTGNFRGLERAREPPTYWSQRVVPEYSPTPLSMIVCAKNDSFPLGAFKIPLNPSIPVDRWMCGKSMRCSSHGTVTCWYRYRFNSFRVNISDLII